MILRRSPVGNATEGVPYRPSCPADRSSVLINPFPIIWMTMTRSTKSLAEGLEQALAELPMFDVHTHLVGGRLGARGLHDILLYHMVISDLYAAGCPSGARLMQYPGWPSQEEAHARIEEAFHRMDKYVFNA